MPCLRCAWLRVRTAALEVVFPETQRGVHGVHVQGEGVFATTFVISLIGLPHLQFDEALAVAGRRNTMPLVCLPGWLSFLAASGF